MIKITDVSFKYDEQLVLKNVSLEFEKGSWISIIGHNGSGKSTLAKIIIGLLELEQGKVEIDDFLLCEENINKIRERIGIVFQNPDNQFVGVTVKHDIAFGLENRQVKREIMLEKIETFSKLVQMNEYLDRQPDTLSGGQKQRVAIAGILAMDLDYIIFDEATSMLDPEGVFEVIDLIKRINKEYNKTVITITHDLDLAKQSDKIVVLNMGEVIMEGTPDDVFKASDVLSNIGLEIPISLSIYNSVLADSRLNQNGKLKEALWKYVSKK